MSVGWSVVATESEGMGVFGHNWEAGDATVVTSQYANGPAGSVAYREYLIDVLPAGVSSPFRTKLGVSYYGGGEATDPHKRFNDGDVFPVLCDAKRKKAKWDYDDPRIYKPGQSPQDRKEQKKEPSEFEIAAAAPAGTPIQSDAGGDVGSGTPLAGSTAPGEAEVDAAFEAYLAASRQMLPLMGAVLEAKASRNQGEKVRLQGELQARRAESERLHQEFLRLKALRPGWREPRDRQAAAPAANDELERLQKLGELHASGVLTDVEFAAEKAKILGQ